VSRHARWARLPFEPGARVGDYTVERLVGEGGVCRVYRATHCLLGTVHALKELISDTRLETRLLREGRLQFSLDANHVVPVTGAFRWQGRTALVMPFVEGCSLYQLLKAYRPTPAEAAALFAQIVASLEVIHEADIIHRDVKPANVLLDVHRGRVRVRLSDFGLARQTTDERRTFGFMGTPEYAAPEQHLDAGSVTMAADLWPLGLVLCELVHQTDIAELARRRRTAPDDAEVLASVPQPWCSLAEDLLSFSAAHRPTATAVRRCLSELDVVLDELTVDGHCAQVVTTLGERLRRDFPTATLPPDWGRDTVAPSHSRPVAPHRSHNLPGSRDRFVGRSADVDAIDDALVHARLVTLRGPAGVGKTRLALHYGHTHTDTWASVWWCAMADAMPRGEIVEAVGRMLGVVLQSDPESEVVEALQARDACLVVLDDAHLAQESVRALLEEWLDACPEARFLTTSHRSIGVVGEHVHVVEPLDVDDALELLVERSRRAGSSGGRPASEDLELRELVEELDRLPLAIELAAARLGTFSVGVLLEHLRADRLETLSQSGPAPAPGRTLAAMLRWAWNRVEPEDRQALGCLTMFEAPFEFEAAATVMGADGSVQAMNVMQRLVENSLLQVVNERFALLNSVRDFAGRHVEPDTAQTAAERHGAYFAALGEEASLAEVSTRGGLVAWERLTRSLPDLRAASRRAVERGDHRVAALGARAVWAVLSLTGPYADGADLLEDVLAMGADDGELQRWVRLDAARAWSRRGLGERALAYTTQLFEESTAGGSTGASVTLLLAELHETVGGVLQDRGELERALDEHQKAVEVARRLRNGRLEGVALGNVANVHKAAGRPSEAQATYEDALRASRRAGNRRHEGLLLGNLGELEIRLGLTDLADLHLGEALAIHREWGNRQSEAFCLVYLAIRAKVAGRIEEAEARFREAMQVHREVGNRRLAAEVQQSIGTLLLHQGRLDEAASAYESALVVHDEFGNRPARATVLGNFGVLEASRGRPDEAMRCFEQAIQLHRSLGRPRRVAIVQSNVASTWLDRGEPDRALDFLGSALAAFRELGNPRDLGLTLGLYGDALRRLGRLHDATAAMQEAEELLRSGDPGFELAELLCLRAELELARGEVGEARRTVHEVAQAIDRLSIEPGSEIHRRYRAVVERVQSTESEEE